MSPLECLPTLSLECLARITPLQRAIAGTLFTWGVTALGAAAVLPFEALQVRTRARKEEEEEEEAGFSSQPFAMPRRLHPTAEQASDEARSGRAGPRRGRIRTNTTPPRPRAPAKPRRDRRH